MTDDEMRAMPIPTLQDEGLLFLWVTGRAMEVGRECLRVWGYTRVDEVVWVKTNQVSQKYITIIYIIHNNNVINSTAPTRNSYRTYGPLAQPYQRTHACGCQDRDRRVGRTQVPVVGQPRFGRGRNRVGGERDEQEAGRGVRVD
jgi:hypothetical protein